MALGVNHIDTSDFYGPHVTNQLICEALHPYRDDLTIVTKIGARRGEDASWLPAFSAQELTQAVHDNLRNLKRDVLDVVNLRIMFSAHGPAEGSIAAPLSTLAELQQQGLVRHIGLSNVTASQVAEAQKMVSVVCVQNMYNVVNRGEDALVDSLAQQGIAGWLSSRWVVSRHCNLPDYRRWRIHWARRRCRWRWHGCCSARQISS